MNRLLTIDGKTASGKTTVALLMAKRLKVPMFSAGHNLRAFALAARARGFVVIRQDGIAECVDKKGCIQLTHSVRIHTDGRDRWLLDGTDITDQLQQPPATDSVAIIAEIPEVREWHDAVMRRYATDRGNRVVFEGRVTGFVFPEAVHVWLEVSPPVAAARIKAGRSEGVLESSHRRNTRDSARKVAPIFPINDAVIVDTDPLDQEAVFELVWQIYQQAALASSSSE